MSNCLYSSLIDKIETFCNCSPIFSVKPTSSSVGMHFNCIKMNQCHKSLFAGGNVTWCIGGQINCVEKQMLNIGDSEYDLDKAYNSVTGKRDKCLRVKVFFYIFMYTMMSDSKKTDLENFLIIIVFIQACYYHKFKLSSSSCKYPSRNIFPNIQEMCMVIRKIENICKVKIRNQNSTNLF